MTNAMALPPPRYGSKDRIPAAAHFLPRRPEDGATANPVLICFENVSKIYGAGEAAVHALDNLNLEIARGEFIAIMGPSGSGKSTAMNILACLDTPTSGRYIFDGIDVCKLDQAQRAILRRHYFSFVFQGFNLLARTTAIALSELCVGFCRNRRASWVF